MLITYIVAKIKIPKLFFDRKERIGFCLVPVNLEGICSRSNISFNGSKEFLLHIKRKKNRKQPADPIIQ